MPARIVHYKNSLHYLLNRSGGITREQAVATAQGNVDDLAQDLLPELSREIHALEEMMDVAREPLSESFIRDLFVRQGVIYNLAGTFGCTGLQQVSASLGELLADMIELGVGTAEPVRVHVRAARMLGPGMPPVLDEALTLLLNHLASVRTFVCSDTAGKKPI